MEKKLYYMHVREMDPDECPGSEDRLLAAILLFETPNDYPTLTAAGKLQSAKIVRDMEEAQAFFEYYLKEHTIMQKIDIVPVYAAKNKNPD